jgi:hypothetical protein
MDIYATNWSETDANNSTASPDGAPVGMAPSGVHGTIRAGMGATKRFVDQQIPLVTGGTSTAYTLSYAVAPSQLYDGMTHLVQFNTINGAAPTLNVNALGAKPLHFWASGGWGAWPANMVAIDQIVRVTYNAAAGTYRAYSMPTVLNQSVSGVTAIDFTGIPTTVRNLQVIFDLIVGTNNVNVAMQFYNSSGVLDTGASAYYYAINTLTTANTFANTAASASNAIGLAISINNSATQGANGDIIIPNIQSVKATVCNFRVNWIDHTGAVGTGGAGYGGRAANGNITGLRLLTSSGTFSGPVSLVMS